MLLTLTRNESLRFHSKRHPMWLDYTLGCDEDEKLLGRPGPHRRRHRRLRDLSDKVIKRAVGHAYSAYGVDNVDIEGIIVYTNDPPCRRDASVSASTRSNFAVEGVLDVLAERVGIDGWEIRWRNALEVGSRFGTGQKLGPGRRPQKTLLAVRNAYRDAGSPGSPAASRTPASATA